MIDQDNRVAARLIIQLGQLTVLTSREPTDLAGGAVVTLGKRQPGLLVVAKILVGTQATAENQSGQQQEGDSISFTSF